MYFLSSKRKGNPKMWSACQCVMRICLKSLEAAVTPQLRVLVGGVSTRTQPSSKVSACILPGGMNALPVPRKSVRAMLG